MFEDYANISEDNRAVMSLENLINMSEENNAVENITNMSEDNRAVMSIENIINISEDNRVTMSLENLINISEENALIENSNNMSEDNVAVMSIESIINMSEENITNMSEDNKAAMSIENKTTVSEDNNYFNVIHISEDSTNLSDDNTSTTEDKNSNFNFFIRQCYACGTKRIMDDSRIHLFRFPQEADRVAQWIENGGFHELKKFNTPRYLSEKRVSLCMRHFDKSQYVNSDMVRLTRYAVPTLFGDDMQPLESFPIRKPSNGPVVGVYGLKDFGLQSKESLRTIDINRSTLAHKKKPNSRRFSNLKEFLVCAVPGCRRSLKQWKSNFCQGRKPSMFTPNNDETRNKWADIIKAEIMSSEMLAVCDIHFAADAFHPHPAKCIRGDKQLSSYLRNFIKKDDAMPTLYLNEVDNLNAKERAKKIEEYDWWLLVENPKGINTDSSEPVHLSSDTPITTNTAQRGGKLGNIPFDHLTSDTDFSYLLLSTQPSETESLLPTTSNEDNFDPIDDMCNYKYPSELRSVKSDILEQVVNAVDDMPGEGFPFGSGPSSKSKKKSPLVKTLDNIVSRACSLGYDVIEMDKQEPTFENPKKRKVESSFVRDFTEAEKKKLQFFRTLRETTLKLPSPKWAVHSHPEENYILICQMSYRNKEFIVERGIHLRFNMPNPDIQVAGKRIQFHKHINLKTVEDVEALVVEVNALPLF